MTVSPHVLVVDDDVMIRALVSTVLEHEGLAVTAAASGAEALEELALATPDLVISDVMMPHMDGFQLITRLRAEPSSREVPVLFLTSRIDPADSATGLRLGANDYLRKPFSPESLVRRVRSHLEQPRRAVDQLLAANDRTVLTTDALLEELEAGGAKAASIPLVRIALEEQLMVEARFGHQGWRDVVDRLTPLVTARLGEETLIAADQGGLVVAPSPLLTPAQPVATSLGALAREIAVTPFAVTGESIHLSPAIGWTEVGYEIPESLERADLAAAHAATHQDLQPVRWTPLLDPLREQTTTERHPLWARLTTPAQIAATWAIGILAPLLTYHWLYLLGIDVSTPMYVLIVLALATTGALIWAEGLHALDPERPPREPAAPEPPATAIIAAFLPNESATIVATIEAFLEVDYPDLQVILAYNSPRGLVVERNLRELAARDPRFLPLRVEGSTSKAQNVNVALRHARGEFVGLYDADHHPHPDSFSRAWRWLSHGYDVVQGHCVIRNGDASRTARTVAVEFEAIYAVSHPGRAKLHGFGIFGGSNGFWRTETLRRTRMHGSMLTEDIDSSLRVITAGGRIANDPALLSRELAPTTWRHLWNQRMRWAQGWFQVSRRHLLTAWRSPLLSVRQKLGMTALLGWREVYPWLSLQMFPLIAFLAWRDGGLDSLDWWIAVFVLTTLFTTSVGPGQTLFAWRLAAPEVRRHRRWFWAYLLFSTLFYTEWKNTIARVAQFKEIGGERHWKVTPRVGAP